MIYCFDLDGTLCSDEGGNYKKAKPFKKRINKINSLFDDGHTIIIDSARGSVTKKDWLSLTKKQLKEWCVKYHQLRVGVKFFANIYVENSTINDMEFFKK